MAIVFSNLGNSGSPDFVAGGAFNYQTASWTPPSSGVILLVVENGESNGYNDPPAVSGNGVAWFQIGTMTYEYDEYIEWDLSRITLFAAEASGSSPGQTTINFGANYQDRCEASFFHAAGVDLSLGVVNAFRQFQSQLGYAASAQINLASPASPNNRPIAVFAHRYNTATTPRTNWTEMDDLLHTTVIGLETQVRQDAFETTASASWSGFAEWGGFVVELKAGIGSSTPVPVFVHHLKQQGIG